MSVHFPMEAADGDVKWKGKRKRDSDESLPGWNLPRGIPQPKETRDLIYKQNQESSPFLQLPGEVRNQIYEYALANKVIHVSVRDCPCKPSASWSYHEYYRSDPDYSHKSFPWSPHQKSHMLKFTHVTCCLPSDEEDYVYRRSCDLTTPFSTDQDQSYAKRHAGCYATLRALKQNWIRRGSSVSPSPKYRPFPSSELPVALLRSCRQIRNESKHLPYTTNTFAFHEGYTFALFLTHGLGAKQSRRIQRIQADGWLSGPLESQAVNWNAVGSLQGLRSLQVCMRSGQHFVLRGVNVFALLNLSDVRVTVYSSTTYADLEGARKARSEAERLEAQIRTGVITGRQGGPVQQFQDRWIAEVMK